MHCTVGQDSDPVSLAVNISRRHLSKGQQAMILVTACSASEQFKVRRTAKESQVSTTRLANANIVLQYGPGLADSTWLCSIRMEHVAVRQRAGMELSHRSGGAPILRE